MRSFLQTARWLGWALACAGCGAPVEEEPACSTDVCVANWNPGHAPLPFADTPADEDCRVSLQLAALDLPSQLPAPTFEARPELEAAVNVIEPGACGAALAYALATDYDGDGDADLVVRRPRSDGSGCDQPTVGVSLSAGEQSFGPFTELEGVAHFQLVGSLDGDRWADAVVVSEGCARVLLFREDVGFAHDGWIALACDEDIGDDDSTATSWDLDRDGDLDLLLATGGANLYFRNDHEDGDPGPPAFTPSLAEVGLTPTGAYPYDPLDPTLADGDVPFDPTRAASFYLYCDHEDPFDPLSPTICQVDNDGPVSFNESYRCDDTGSCTWVDDRVVAGCDRITASMYSSYLCDADISPAQYDNLVTTTAQLLARDRDQATVIGHSSGSPVVGDNTNPMSIAPFAIWPYAFEFKAQSEGVVADTVVVWERGRGWLQFEPYHLDNGRSSNGYEQQSWGSVALEDGSGWPLLVSARGFDGMPGMAASDVRPLLEQLLETALPCLERVPGAPFGLADVGVTVVGPDGRLHTLGEVVVDEDGPRSTGPIPRLGVYKTVAPAWLDGALHLLIGGFDGGVRIYRVGERGNVLRLQLDPGPGRAPHGYGAVVFAEVEGRLRGPKTIGADGVQPNLGSHRDSWDFGLGDVELATVYVLWPWGERERFAAVAAGPATLSYGAGELDPALPEALATVLDDELTAVDERRGP